MKLIEKLVNRMEAADHYTDVHGKVYALGIYTGAHLRDLRSGKSVIPSNKSAEDKVNKIIKSYDKLMNNKEKKIKSIRNIEVL